MNENQNNIIVIASDHANTLKQLLEKTTTELAKDCVEAIRAEFGKYTLDKQYGLYQQKGPEDPDQNNNNDNNNSPHQNRT